MHKERVGVVYLARNADGIAAFKRFAESYRRQPAGTAHELIVIYKGFMQQAELRRARDVFFDLPHVGLEFDDAGFDVGTYLEACRRLNHDHLLFLNTHSVISASSWLAAMTQYASRPAVG